jgi:hypothetical protein
MFPTMYRVTQKNILMHVHTLQKSSISVWFETTYHWSSLAYNTSHADKHVARAWISFRYLSSYNRCPHWSVWAYIKNISMYFCLPLARTPCMCCNVMCTGCIYTLEIPTTCILFLIIYSTRVMLDMFQTRNRSPSWRVLYKQLIKYFTAHRKRGPVADTIIRNLPATGNKLSEACILFFFLMYVYHGARFREYKECI